MSVINETLDNLKRSKKKTATVNPALKAERETVVNSQTHAGLKTSYLIPVGFATLVGAFFYFSPDLSPRVMQSHQNEARPDAEYGRATESKRLTSFKNQSAQKMYYKTMALLNEGKDEQAIVGLQKIIAQYPDFQPAKQVYSMLVSR